jgi:hypothetical protein
MCRLITNRLKFCSIHRVIEDVTDVTERQFGPMKLRHSPINWIFFCFQLHKTTADIVAIDIDVKVVANPLLTVFFQFNFFDVVSLFATKQFAAVYFYGLCSIVTKHGVYCFLRLHCFNMFAAALFPYDPHFLFVELFQFLPYSCGSSFSCVARGINESYLIRIDVVVGGKLRRLQGLGP